tara:strand:+ start:9964 stop:10086 length:123 start_codon:yes stop_codon:yes gene_type:complete
MKKILFALFVFLIACTHQIDKKDLVGSWDCTSAKDIETNK